MRLCEGSIDRRYLVEKIDLPFALERRLEALGMTIDGPIETVDKKGKGIMIIKIRGTRFALGYNITKNIIVREDL